MQKAKDFDPAGKKILVVSAHPDDVDFCAGGTLLKWLSQGARASILVCTNGDKGSSSTDWNSDQLAKIRHDEQLAASKFLGLENTWFLDFPDAHLELNLELKNYIARFIRIYQPEVVLTFDPTVRYSTSLKLINHPDHLVAGEATLAAVYPLARDYLTFPAHIKEGLKPHKVKDVFLYNFDNANFWVDITNEIEKKFSLLEKHTSQVKRPEIDNFVLNWNEMAGEKIGAKYAESFVHLEID